MVKRALARLVPGPSDPGFRVLLYHAVDEADPADRLSLRISPAAFRAQMEFLRTERYRVVPLRSLPEGVDSDAAPQVAITFDDGYRSQLHAAAILEELGFPATFFVVIRFLDGDRTETGYWGRWEHMGWTDVQALSSRGFEIGAHSISHARLTRCSSAQLRAEVAGAKAQIEDRLGQAVVSFSYPHGVYNAAVQRTVQEAGFRLGCTSVCGTNRFPWRWFELRRTEISGDDHLVDFQQKLQGKYDWLGSWQSWRVCHA